MTFTHARINTRVKLELHEKFRQKEAENSAEKKRAENQPKMSSGSGSAKNG